MAQVSESLFGTERLDDVLSVFVILEDRGIDFGNAYSYFYQMFTRRWASVWGYPPSDRDLLHIKGHRKVQPASLCFRKMIVLHQCIVDCNSNDLSWPWKLRVKEQFLFTTGGPRSVARDGFAIELFRRRVRSCLGLPERRVNRDHPRVVYALRTQSRRHLGLSSKMQALVEAFFSPTGGINARSFDIAEHVKVNPAGFLRLVYDADILIGHWGAGLVFQILMPEDAVTIQLDQNSYCAGKGQQGWNVVPLCDYGGDAFAANLSHMLVALPESTTVVHDDKHSGYDVSEETYVQAVSVAACAIRRADARHRVQLVCPFPASWYHPRRIRVDAE